MRLLIYSKALYSTWTYYNADRLLFDAGEGASSILGNKTFAIKRILLSHGHSDHVAGLVSIVNIRNNAMGDKEKGLTIYYPKGNYLISQMINYIERTNRHLSYQLEWKPLRPGDRIKVLCGQLPRYIEAFPTTHVHSETSLGYNVVERRHRLKSELSGASQQEIVKIVHEQGREAVTEEYEQKLFSYGGDSVPISPQYISGTEVLWHDTTFLDEQDRKEYKHATLKEAIATAKKAKVSKELICAHISARYKGRIRAITDAGGYYEGVDFKITLVPPGRIFNIG